MPQDKLFERDLAALGQAVREVRELQGVSTSELAATTGIAPQHIVSLESGQLDPAYELLLELADGVGVRPSEFVIRAEQIKGRAR